MRSSRMSITDIINLFIDYLNHNTINQNTQTTRTEQKTNLINRSQILIVDLPAKDTKN